MAFESVHFTKRHLTNIINYNFGRERERLASFPFARKLLSIWESERELGVSKVPTNNNNTLKIHPNKSIINAWDPLLDSQFQLQYQRLNMLMKFSSREYLSILYRVTSNWMQKKRKVACLFLITLAATRTAVCHRLLQVHNNLWFSGVVIHYAATWDFFTWHP